MLHREQYIEKQGAWNSKWNCLSSSNFPGIGIILHCRSARRQAKHYWRKNIMHSFVLETTDSVSHITVILTLGWVQEPKCQLKKYIWAQTEYLTETILILPSIIYVISGIRCQLLVSFVFIIIFSSYHLLISLLSSTYHSLNNTSWSKQNRLWPKN